MTREVEVDGEGGGRVETWRRTVRMEERGRGDRRLWVEVGKRSGEAGRR